MPLNALTFILMTDEKKIQELEEAFKEEVVEVVPDSQA